MSSNGHLAEKKVGGDFSLGGVYIGRKNKSTIKYLYYFKALCTYNFRGRLFVQFGWGISAVWVLGSRRVGLVGGNDFSDYLKYIGNNIAQV